MPLRTSPRVCLPLFLISLFAGLPTANTTQCYYPNGQANTDTACNPDADQSFCCATGYVCLENKICLSLATNSDPKWNRGSCTDQTFASSECPTFCQDTAAAGGAWVSDCGPVNASVPNAGQEVCCAPDGTSSCCDTKNDVFVLSGATSAITTIGGAAATTISSASSSRSTSVSTLTPSSTLPSSSSFVGSTTASASPTSTPSKSGSSKISGGAIAGAVIGAIVGVGLICLVTFALCVTYGRKRSGRETRAELPQNEIYQSPGQTEKTPVEMISPQAANELEASTPLRR